MEENNKIEAYKINPKDIVVVEDFNSRNNFGDIEELARQIKENGVLNPITVSKTTDNNGNTKYKLVDGERRYRAVMSLINNGVEVNNIPALFVDENTNEENLLIQQAIRNEGDKFNEYEWGILATKLRDRCGLSNMQIAKKLGKNQGVVTYWFQLLKMRDEIKFMVRDGLISGSDVRRIMTACDHDEDKAYKELLKLNKKANEQGKTKITLKDFDEDDLYNVVKDGKEIKKGLITLQKYILSYQNKNKDSKVVFQYKDIKYIIENINENGTITDLIDNIMNNNIRKAE